MSKIYQFRIYARYEDDSELYFDGEDESDCMWQVANACEKHGACTYYTPVNDEYHVDGEYIPPDEERSEDVWS